MDDGAYRTIVDEQGMYMRKSTLFSTTSILPAFCAAALAFGATPALAQTEAAADQSADDTAAVESALAAEPAA